MTKESFSLPAGGDWEWSGDWYLDFSGEVDKEGWEYAFDFTEVMNEVHMLYCFDIYSSRLYHFMYIQYLSAICEAICK